LENRSDCRIGALQAAFHAIPTIQDFIAYMPSFKQPTFQERAALAAKAKQSALEKMRAKAPIDEAALAQKQAARLAKEAAEAKAREEKRAALEQEKAERKARALEKAARAEKASSMTEAERKAARDARYAARKSRVGKR
jgi:hypothetical protein